MKMKALVAFKSKLLTPCRKLLTFRFKLRKPLFIRSLASRTHRSKTRKTSTKNRILTALHSVFHKKSRKMDVLGELKSVPEVEREKRIYTSPLTPAYITASRTAMRESFGGDQDVEDACRSFENYLVDMIVEEGKVRDLIDVEELLYCWKNLKCPVFVDVVCRFYGELCKDLFSPEDDNDIDYSAK
ncbi:transcription repressor OFP17 [Mercurialis annua]|uniref:transcription repressor OFP17 n=1 Tax=Mercurialis annua TaxID=3986 RepID=UPI0021605B23|nr:transcription repressor OFP17 [Mercurialis annua]